MDSERKHLGPTIFFSFLSTQPNTLQKVFLPIFSPKFSIYPISPPNKHTLVSSVISLPFLFFFFFFSSTHSPNLRTEAPRLKPHLSPNLKLIRGPSLTCSSLPPPPSSLSLSLMFSILVDLVFVGFGWI